MLPPLTSIIQNARHSGMIAKIRDIISTLMKTDRAFRLVWESSRYWALTVKPEQHVAIVGQHERHARGH